MREVWDAIVLAGGSARRLGGVDKPGLRVGGRTLLEHAVAAVAGAATAVVVGPPRPLDTPVVWCREDPPGGGPVAAVAAGLARTTAPTIVLLAADLPGVAPAVPLLLASLDTDPDAGLAVLVDESGRPNYLAAAWRRAGLVAALASLDRVEGASMRALVRDVAMRELADSGGWGRDCDTWDDVQLAQDQSGRYLDG